MAWLGKLWLFGFTNNLTKKACRNSAASFSIFKQKLYFSVPSCLSSSPSRTLFDSLPTYLGSSKCRI